ncbi:hypothetical protein E3N88_22978 [Mikania micrantha]|uniref:Uncharacterized protein n=1 Tax=Mikania micrantha TaxID=192012 RepID=A0A5N6NDP5_9ASTR|nr:hypothetical protein E3N88_22978 [Mikania micrantha]
MLTPPTKYEVAESEYEVSEGKYEARDNMAVILGQDDEIRRCIQILSRRTKHNPVVVGAKFEGVKCSYGRVDIMRSFRAKSYWSEMFIND